MVCATTMIESVRTFMSRKNSDSAFSALEVISWARVLCPWVLSHLTDTQKSMWKSIWESQWSHLKRQIQGLYLRNVEKDIVSYLSHEFHFNTSDWL